METNFSLHEKLLTIDGVCDGTRNDGRRLSDYRPIYLKTGVLRSTNGSASVHLGETEILVSVKAELRFSENEDIENKLRFFVDISPLSSESYNRNSSNECAEELTNILSAAYENAEIIPDLEKLMVSPTVAWILCVDVTIVQIGGNVVDAMSLGVKAALSDTKICKVVKRPADGGKIHVDLPEETNTWALDFSKAPLIIGVNKIGDSSVVDASRIEECCATSSLVVSVIPPSDLMKSNGDECTLIGSVKKIKGGTFEQDSIDEMLDKAMFAANKLNAAFIQWQKESQS